MKGKRRGPISPEYLSPDDILQLNEWDIPFANNVRYHGVTFDRRMDCSQGLAHLLRAYSTFKCACIGTNIKLTL
jgi:hypothetical protein